MGSLADDWSPSAKATRTVDASKLMRVQSLRQTQHRQPEYVEGDPRTSGYGGRIARCRHQSDVEREAVDERDDDAAEEIGFDTRSEIENPKEPFDGVARATTTLHRGRARRGAHFVATIRVELEEDADVASPELLSEPLPERVDGEGIVLHLVRHETLPLPIHESVGQQLDDGREEVILVAEMIVDERLADTRFARDTAHGQLGGAHCRDLPSGRVENPTDWLRLVAEGG